MSKSSKARRKQTREELRNPNPPKISGGTIKVQDEQGNWQEIGNVIGDVVFAIDPAKQSGKQSMVKVTLHGREIMVSYLDEYGEPTGESDKEMRERIHKTIMEEIHRFGDRLKPRMFPLKGMNNRGEFVQTGNVIDSLMAYPEPVESPREKAVKQTIELIKEKLKEKDKDSFQVRLLNGKMKTFSRSALERFASPYVGPSSKQGGMEQSDTVNGVEEGDENKQL